MTKINILWVGDRLSTMEQLVLRSHLKQGHEVHLWAYEALAGVPDGVVIREAAGILAADQIFVYQVGPGKGSVSAFSNLFRYKLLIEEDGFWCDSDVFALKPFNWSQEYVVASETLPNGVVVPTSCVLKLPYSAARFCYDKARKQNYNTLMWGAIGPALVGEMVAAFELHHYVAPSSWFCPVNWLEAQRYPPIGSWHDLSGSYGVHLWNEMWRRNGTDKDAQHEGSLYEHLRHVVLS
jgi:hypothetical protein